MSIEHAIEAERCRRDAHYFIFDSGKLKTKDEQDHEHPIKSVPDYLYLRMFLDCLLAGSKLIKPEQARFALQNGIAREFLDYFRVRRVVRGKKPRSVHYQPGLLFHPLARQIRELPVDPGAIEKRR